MKGMYLGRRFYRQMFCAVLLTPVVVWRRCTPSLRWSLWGNWAWGWCSTWAGADGLKSAQITDFVYRSLPFPLALNDSRSALAVKGPLRRFVPWTAPGWSRGHTVYKEKRGFLYWLLVQWGSGTDSEGDWR